MMAEDNELFNKQKEMLETFLKTGAIDKRQYEKSLNGLKEKMNIVEKNSLINEMRGGKNENKKNINIVNMHKFNGM